MTTLLMTAFFIGMFERAEMRSASCCIAGIMKMPLNRWRVMLGRELGGD
ncbi:hypothetical protein [Burkholderia latens]|nr:hypothetical protein [Burkholderia latens]